MPSIASPAMSTSYRVRRVGRSSRPRTAALTTVSGISTMKNDKFTANSGRVLDQDALDKLAAEAEKVMTSTSSRRGRGSVDQRWGRGMAHRHGSTSDWHPMCTRLWFLERVVMAGRSAKWRVRRSRSSWPTRRENNASERTSKTQAYRLQPGQWRGPGNDPRVSAQNRRGRWC